MSDGVIEGDARPPGTIQRIVGHSTSRTGAVSEAAGERLGVPRIRAASDNSMSLDPGSAGKTTTFAASLRHPRTALHHQRSDITSSPGEGASPMLVQLVRVLLLQEQLAQVVALRVDLHDLGAQAGI